MRKILIIFLLISSALTGTTLKYGGFIRFDTFYNLRQIVASRECHFYLYPKTVANDETNWDENSIPMFNMTSFQTRLGLTILPEKYGNYSISGKVEGDFFGTTNGLENIVRLRHAFIKISKASTQILLGQYWSPLFTVEVYPGVLNFNTGAPIQPFARFPQISLYKNLLEKLQLKLSITMQRDAYQEILGKSIQQRAGIPAIHLHSVYQYSSGLVGLGWTQKSLRPEKVIINETAFTVYGKTEFDAFKIKYKYVSGTDLSDHLMMGGLAKITNFDSSTTYLGTRVSSYWIDLEFNYKSFMTGLFTGFTLNQGIDDHEDQMNSYMFYARSPEIEKVARISPRLIWKNKNLHFGLEYDITLVLYTSEFDSHLKPIANTSDEPVLNHRILFASYLTF